MCKEQNVKQQNTRHVSPKNLELNNCFYEQNWLFSCANISGEQKKIKICRYVT